MNAQGLNEGNMAPLYQKPFDAPKKFPKRNGGGSDMKTNTKAKHNNNHNTHFPLSLIFLLSDLDIEIILP